VVFWSEWGDPQTAGKELGRYTRTKEVLNIRVPFKWLCATTSVAQLPSNKSPSVTLFGRQSSPLSKAKSGPLRPTQALVGLGKKCSNNGDCVSNRCDRGFGTANTSRCIPNDGKGGKGDYCTHPNHRWRRGQRWRREYRRSGQRW
jgi:hypothetical protein